MPENCLSSHIVTPVTPTPPLQGCTLVSAPMSDKGKYLLIGSTDLTTLLCITATFASTLTVSVHL